MPWMAPSLRVKWGPYFKPDPLEQQQMVQMVQLALGGGPSAAQPIITQRIAVEQCAGVFGIDNVDAILEEIEKETDERAQRELDAATAVIGAKASAQGSQPNAGGKPAGSPGGSGRTASGKDDA